MPLMPPPSIDRILNVALSSHGKGSRRVCRIVSDLRVGLSRSEFIQPDRPLHCRCNLQNDDYSAGGERVYVLAKPSAHNGIARSLNRQGNLVIIQRVLKNFDPGISLLDF